MPLNIEEEKKFETLRKNCRDLGIPSPPEIYIGFEVVDRDGDLIFEDRQRGHSWTRNFYNWLLSGASNCSGTQTGTYGAGNINAKQTNGDISDTVGYVASSGSALEVGKNINGVNNSNAYGIVIGTGSDNFSPENYALNSIVSTSDMAHSAQAASVKTYDNTSGSETWTVTQSRIFNNHSGNSIEIKETGIITNSKFFYGVDRQYLLERSVLDPTVTVPNGAQLTVSYDISMDFSAIDGA